MKLRLFGQANSLGGGTHYSEFFEALRNAKVPGLAIEAFDPGVLEPLAVAAAQSTPHDINLWFWPDQNATFFRGRKIVWGIFESTRLPPSISRSSKVLIAYGCRARGVEKPSSLTELAR